MLVFIHLLTYLFFMNKFKKQISKFLLSVLILSNFSFLNISQSFADKWNNFSSTLNWVLDNTRLDNVDWIIIKFKKSKFDLSKWNAIQNIKNIAESKWLKLDKSVDSKNISSFKINDKKISLEKIVQNLKSEDYVEKVQLNYKYKINSINSNDSLKDNLWALDNYAQSIVGQIWYSGSDISWDKASNIFSWVTSSSNTWVIVAVLDSWVAYNHPDLINQMWDWSSCKNENWVYLWNCIHWYDFADNDKNPSPLTETHGTHVAWTIASQMNNWAGIIWVNPNAKIMAIRMGDSSFNTLSIIKSIYFAKENWAKIINASFWAFWLSAFDELEYEAIKDFTDAGWIFIAAAWNENWNNDSLSDRFFPASFGVTNYVDSNGYLTGSLWAWVSVFTWITNIISVAATDNRDDLASFSNYWESSVNVWAPGVSIYSTILSELNYFTWSDVSDFIIWWLNNSWVKDWNWYLWTDYRANYLSWVDTYIEKSIDISNLNSPSLEFLVWCDAAKTLAWLNNYTTDYASLSFSTGWSFLEYAKYNYTSSYLIYSFNWGYYSTIAVPLENYKNQNFKFRFNWHTDSISDTENWCFFTNINLKANDNGALNNYWFLDGTSMASPHVAWLASLAWSYKPNLSGTSIKNAILDNWDLINSLSWKTTTWKRINAFKTLLSLTDTWSITQLKAYSSSWKTTELSSWAITNNPSVYLEWFDSTNAWAIEKYKIQIKDNSGNLLETESYSSGNTLNSSDILLWTWLLSSGYTWTSLKYVVTPILYDGREWWSRELNLVYDITDPIISSISYENNDEVSSSSIILTWSIFDLNLSWSISINWTWISLSNTWFFSTNISLNPWLNNINIEASDLAGNTSSTWINIVRIWKAPDIYSSISNWNINLSFSSEFIGTWVFLYWTWWNLDNTFTWEYLDYHTANIPYIGSEEIYYYRTYYIRDWYNSVMSRIWTIMTPKLIDLSTNLWALDFTWAINISNATSTWIIIDGTWSITLYSDTWSSLISFNRWIEIISASWNWDSSMQAPKKTTSTWTINVVWYSRIWELTFKIWSDSDWLIFSWWTVSVKLDVWNTYNWKNLKIYRSEDQQVSFVYVWDCLVSTGICSFDTNNFSDFTLFEASDASPDAFSFTSISSAELNTQYTSNTITVTWINTSTWITASAWTLVIDWIDSGTSGTVSSWTTVSVKLTSSASYSSVVSSSINIWWVVWNYTITTKWAPVVSSPGGGGGWSSVSTCLDSQLVCTNWIYYRKSWVSCNDWNLWKACTIVSTWITNTWIIITNNLGTLLEKIKADPSLNKTYAIQSSNLKDISNHFSKKYVDELISRKIIKWYDDNTFRPDNAITRAEYLSIIMKALGVQVDSNLNQSSFSDVESWSWIIKYIEKAKKEFDISAKTDKFRPNDFITRAEALAILFKISKLSLQTNGANTFVDSDLETWMQKYTTKAKSLGLVKWQEINGKTYFKPNSNITRAETSKIVVNLLKIMWK